ncbi:uncharacterized protein LOC130628699 [Hydractinia symbiolongicarpus]|uniref:uncharacterized protein LOC130628699 n=1 Tax=Hydractinia symbiolongicarpus TaxID=13093 RepID=UPI0025504D3D|nr:uncharacterized protein LOC130628699 [Hydractinia symbiolongicarpus]
MNVCSVKHEAIRDLLALSFNVATRDIAFEYLSPTLNPNHSGPQFINLILIEEKLLFTVLDGRKIISQRSSQQRLTLKTKPGLQHVTSFVVEDSAQCSEGGNLIINSNQLYMLCEILFELAIQELKSRIKFFPVTLQAYICSHPFNATYVPLAMATLQSIILKYEKWFRLGLLHHEVLKDTLLQTFHKNFSTDSKKLYNELHHKYGNKLRQLLQNGVLKQDQYDLIFPPGLNETYSSKFDITLLGVLIKNCPKIDPPVNGWTDNNPPSTDLTLAAKLIRVLSWRNWHCHVDPENIDLLLYESKWKEGIDIAKSLGYNGDANVLSTTSLDAGRTSVLESLVERVRLDNDNLKKRMSDIEGNNTDLSTKCCELRKVCGSLHSHIDSLSIRVTDNDNIIEQWKRELTNLQKELQQYLTRLERVETRVDNCEEDIQHLQIAMKEKLVVQDREHLWNVPLNVSNFTGREEILENIYSNLHKQEKSHPFNAVCLTGLGGVGKTELAARYARLNRKHYQYIFWIQADNLQSSLQSMCEYFDVKSYYQSIEAMVLKLSAKIGSCKCLFVLDNAENFTSIDPLLRNLTLDVKYCVIVTSQHTQWQNLCLEQFEITIFTEIEAYNFFKELVPDENSAKKLAKELEYFPLAMQLSLSYIKRHSMNIEEYLEAFRQGKSQLFYERNHDNKTLLTVWRMAIEKLKSHEHKVAIDVLNMMAYMDNTFINMNTFLLYDKIPDKVMLNSVIDILCEYSLISKKETKIKAGQVVTIHKLIQRILTEFEELTGTASNSLNVLVGILQAACAGKTTKFDIDDENIWFLHIKYLLYIRKVLITFFDVRFQTVAVQRGDQAIIQYIKFLYLTTNYENLATDLNCAFNFASYMIDYGLVNEALEFLDNVSAQSKLEKNSLQFLLFQIRCIQFKCDYRSKTEARRQYNEIKDFLNVDDETDVCLELMELHAQVLVNFSDFKHALQLIDKAIQLCLKKGDEKVEERIKLLMRKCDTFCIMEKLDDCISILNELDDLFKKYDISGNQEITIALKVTKCSCYFARNEFEETRKICLDLLDASFDYKSVNLAKFYLARIDILTERYKDAIIKCDLPVPQSIIEKDYPNCFRKHKIEYLISLLKVFSYFHLNELDMALQLLQELRYDERLVDAGEFLEEYIDVINQLKECQEEARQLHQSGNTKKFKEVMKNCQDIKQQTKLTKYNKLKNYNVVVCL